MRLPKSLLWKIRSSERVISSAQKKFEKKLAIAWTGGKDSTVLLHMVRRLNNGEIPFPVMFIDTGLHFDETREFVEKMKHEWNLSLYRIKDNSGLRAYRTSKSRLKKKEIARKMKISCIKKAIRKYKWNALMAGIRWDEHRARASETYFSQRKNHMRVHPILHFTEANIWEYIKHYQLLYNPLYDQGYRSIGEKDFTKPVKDPKKGERAGREKEKDKIMERLRALGYF